MWTREQLKNRAKYALKMNYWKIVLVCIILSLVNASGSSGSNSDSEANLKYENHAFDHYGTDMLPLDEYNQFYSGTADVGESVLSLLEMGLASGFVLLIVIFAVIVGIVIGIFICNPIDLGGRKFLVKSLYEPAELNEILYGFNSNYKNIVKVLFFRDLSIFLWSLLFIIPGIIKSYEYYMVPYLLTENPNLSKEEAFRISKEMMDGEKWNTFVLELSFLGWYFLSAFTFGILNVFYVGPYENLTKAALFDELNAAHGYPARYVRSGYEQIYE